MLRLTLRSSTDGSFLARIMHRDGFAFVLDYGDPLVIAEASRRLLKGFTVWRWGQLHTVAPTAVDLLPLLSELYLQEGRLVFLEEPTWPKRDHSLEDRLPGPFSAAVRELRDLETEDELTDLLDGDDATEIVSLHELPDLLADVKDEPTRATWRPPVDGPVPLEPLPMSWGDEDDPTELIEPQSTEETELIVAPKPRDAD